MASSNSSSRKKSRVGIYIKSVLQRKVVLSFDLLGGNLKKNLLVSLQNNLEGKCSTEGYIKKKSIQVITYSAGVIDGSNVNFVVTFECLICKPCEGMSIKCLVKNKTKAGSRHYIHASDVADGCLFLIKNRKKIIKKNKIDYGGAKCPKFNLVGPIELDNLELAKLIAKSVGKILKYKMVDFHSSRPGHDLRYALDGNLMKKLGWKPKVSIEERIDQVVDWTLKNKRWLKI